MQQAKTVILSLSRELNSSRELNTAGLFTQKKSPSQQSKTRLHRSGSWPLEKPRMKPAGDPSDILPVASLLQGIPTRVKSAAVKVSPRVAPPSLLGKDKQEMSGDEESGTTSNTTEASSPSLRRSDGLVRSKSGTSPPKVARILFPLAPSPSASPPGSSASSPHPPSSTESPAEVQTSRTSLLQLAEFDSLRSLKETKQWSVREVGVWLSALGLEGYKPMFEKNAVRGADLADLTESDLVELGVSKIGHKKVILQSIADLSAPSVKKSGSRKGPSPGQQQQQAQQSKSPRSGGPSPRPGPALSPRRGGSPAASAAVSPRPNATAAIVTTTRRDLTETLFVKVRCGGKMVLLETTRLVSFAELSRLCARAAGVSSVRTLHFVDPEKELTLVKNESDLAFVFESLTSHTCNLIINK